MSRRRAWLVAIGVVLLVAFVAVKLVDRPTGSGLLANKADAPFGPFAGYVTVGPVTSVGASMTVPKIASGSPPGLAGTWIGAQGYGPPRRFVQIGVNEVRDRVRGHVSNGYLAFWSDSAHRFLPVPLFRVKGSDVVAASISLAHGRWTLAIRDRTSGAAKRFSTAQDTGGPFEQAEWSQEDPGSEGHHVSYPLMSSPEFRDLTVNGAAPVPSRMYSEWMSVNGGSMAPTALRSDSFALTRAPAVSAAGRQYMRLAAPWGEAFERFEDERAGWTPATPYGRIAAASAALLAAGRRARRAFEDARWPPRIRRLIATQRGTTDELVADARPPSPLTPASFAEWNEKLSLLIERRAPAGAELRLALGLPAFGASYRR